MKIYFAGEPGGNISSKDIRLQIMKNRLLSYYFIYIRNSKSKKEFETIINKNEK